MNLDQPKYTISKIQPQNEVQLLWQYGPFLKKQLEKS